MRDHGKLREHWNAATGGMAERLAAVNGITEPGPRRPVEMSWLVDVLVKRGRWRALQIHAVMGRTVELRQRLGQSDVSAGVKSAAYLLALIHAGGALQVSQFGVLKKLVDDICADSILGSDDVSALWALSETSLPWWKGVYGHPIGVFDLIEAQLAA
jgi:hypothetical protein